MALVQYIIEIHVDWEGDPDAILERFFDTPEAAIAEDDILALRNLKEDAGYTDVCLRIFNHPAEPRTAYFKCGNETGAWRCPTHYADGEPVEKEYRDNIARALYKAQR